MTRVFKLIFALTVVLTMSGYYGGGTPEVGGGSGMPAAVTTALTAVVGPGATITLKKGTTKVTSLKKGSYKIAVDDKSSFHNFHLTGPNINKTTTVNEVAKKTWTLTLNAGTFKYVCDPHKSSMKGSFTVTN